LLELYYVQQLCFAEAASHPQHAHFGLPLSHSACLPQVMANTKIPEPNKTQAQLQLLRVFADCITAINDWATSTMCAPAFETLHPALLELAPAISKSVLIQSEDLALPKCSKTAGRLMEAAAVQVGRSKQAAERRRK
jgi:hypothetical protein